MGLPIPGSRLNTWMSSDAINVRRENRIEDYGGRVGRSKRGPKVLFTIIEGARASEFSSTTLVSPLAAAAVFMSSY